MLKMMIVAGLLSSSMALAADQKNHKDIAAKMVENGKVVKEDGSEFSLQTAKGTIVEVELNNDGTIDEASGDSVMGGDVFAPGNGLMSLAQATAALKKAGKNPTGDWSFDKSMRNGWIYKFEGVEDGKDRKYEINAKSGALVKDSRELL